METHPTLGPALLTLDGVADSPSFFKCVLLSYNPVMATACSSSITSFLGHPPPSHPPGHPPATHDVTQTDLYPSIRGGGGGGGGGGYGGIEISLSHVILK